LLISVATRARSIDERRDAFPVGQHGQTPQVEDPDRRARWCATAARGVDADFVVRLNHLGLFDPGDLARVLTETGSGQVAAAPQWLEILEAASRRPSSGTDRVVAGHELDAVLAPLLEEALDRLAASNRDVLRAGVSEDAVVGLRDGLRRDLSRVMGPCIDTELSASRVRLGTPVPQDLWQRFEQDLGTSGLFGLWDDYPVLARLVGVRLLDWIDRSAELLRRFVLDRPELARTFGIAGEPQLESVELAGSDPHNGHAEVAVCTVSGQRLVYKPKDLSAEALWSDLIRWANRVGLDLGEPGEVLLGDGYGWAGYVEQLPADALGARRFYERCGRLAAMLFVLGGNDAHAENVIACGDTPVVIDAETLLQPTIPTEDGERSPEWVSDALLLPRWLRIGGTAVGRSRRCGLLNSCVTSADSDCVVAEVRRNQFRRSGGDRMILLARRA
jgi:hypothetical protein